MLFRRIIDFLYDDFTLLWFRIALLFSFFILPIPTLLWINLYKNKITFIDSLLLMLILFLVILIVYILYKLIQYCSWCNDRYSLAKSKYEKLNKKEKNVLKSLLFLSFIAICIVTLLIIISPNKQDRIPDIVISILLIIYLFLLLSYLTLIEGAKKRSLSYLFASLNFLIAFFALNISIHSEVVRQNNGLQHAICKSIHFHKNSLSRSRKFISYNIDSTDFLLPKLANKGSLVKNKSDSIYIYFVDCFLDRSGSLLGKNISDSINSVGEKIRKIQKVIPKEYWNNDSCFVYYDKTVSEKRKGIMSTKYNINKINICYDLIQLYENDRAQSKARSKYELHDSIQIYVKLWCFDDSAKVIKINPSDYAEYFHIGDTTNLYKAISSVLYLKPNNKKSGTTNFVKLFDTYYQNLIRVRSYFKKIPDERSYVMQSLYSDGLHDINITDSIDLFKVTNDKLSVEAKLRKIDELNILQNINIIRLNPLENNAFTFRIEDISKNILKQNCKIHYVTDTNYLPLLKLSDYHYDLDPIAFFYQEPSSDSSGFALIFKSSLNLGFKLKWLDNIPEFNPNFSYFTDSLRKIKNDIQYSVPVTNTIKFVYKGEFMGAMPNLRLNMYDRTLGTEIVRNIYFTKVFNRFTIVAIIVLFLGVSIIFLIILCKMFRISFYQ